MVFSNNIGVRPLFDRVSCTYTYLVYDRETLDAVIIDPVRETFSRDLRVINQMGLKLSWCLETHVHADHITSAALFVKEFGVKIALGEKADVECRNAVQFSDNQFLEVTKDLKIRVITTPGHTICSVCFHVEDFLFTGDTLFVRGCGRTDFQMGSPRDLYESVHRKLYILNDETRVLPGHDYNGEMFSTIGEEKKFNPRLQESKGLEEFTEIMNHLNLPYPEKIDQALPANLRCGEEA
ncbi:Zn-dependent hydrolase [Halobacteriovorax marinus]|uniref:Zn-dependent hydrolase n=1 Tax=Halobacteriovorax marinus TaxID=97084 RepID=A0A1Y5F913_9BACT|nr:Zn-dependent hydrolase [Halobacteriovorax marinus]